MHRLFYFVICMHRNRWKVGLLVTKSLCNIYTLNVDSVDILMRTMVDVGGVAVLYYLATRPKPDFFSQFGSRLYPLKMLTVCNYGKPDQ